MARALDAGSGDAFTGRTSELRGKEKDPQPDRVGFKQFEPSEQRSLQRQILALRSESVIKGPSDFARSLILPTLPVLCTC